MLWWNNDVRTSHSDEHWQFTWPMLLQSQRLMANTKALLLLNQDPSWSCSHQQGLFFIIRCVSSQCAPCKAFVSMLHATVKPYHSCSSGNWVNVCSKRFVSTSWKVFTQLKIGIGFFSPDCVLKYFSPVHYSSLLSLFLFSLFSTETKDDLRTCCQTLTLRCWTYYPYPAAIRALGN